MAWHTEFDQAWAILKGWDVSYHDPTLSERVFGRDDIDWYDESISGGMDFGYGDLSDDWYKKFKEWEKYKNEMWDSPMYPDRWEELSEILYGEGDNEAKRAWRAMNEADEKQDEHRDMMDEIIQRYRSTDTYPFANVRYHPAAPGNLYVDSPEGRMYFRTLEAMQERFPKHEIVTGDDGVMYMGDLPIMKDPEMGVTYNYNSLWPEDFNFRDLYGRTGEQSRPELERVLQHLELIAQREYGQELNPDYISSLDAGEEGRWGTEGMEGLQNAAEPIRTMIRWADRVPHGEFMIY